MGITQGVRNPGAAVAAAALLTAFVAFALLPAAPAPTLSSPTANSLDEAYGDAPLAFTRAVAAPGADFGATTAAGTVALGPTGAVISKELGDHRMATIPITLAGASAGEPDAIDRLPGVVNDLRGDDSSKWRTGVPTFARVRYRGVYPGIAMDYHGTTGTLEYDFRLAPHADPSRIAVDFGGAPLRIAKSGALVAGAPGRSIRQAAPVAYQTGADGTRDPVDASFRIDHGKVGFDLGAYDHARPLVIDPLVLDYSTYLGGTGDYDQLSGIAVDSAGNAYVAGFTSSADFPTTGGAYDTSQFSAGNYDAVVTKLNPTGTGAVYSTYLGGSDSDVARDVAVDGSGNAYVTGYTRSLNDSTPANNFPTSTIYGDSGDPGSGDVFVTKLNPSGGNFVYSMTFGGQRMDEPRGIAVDSGGNAYVAGKTESNGLSGSISFPTTSGVTQTLPGGNGSTDAFVSKVNDIGTGLLYSTYLGGAGQDEANGIDIDSQGRAYVTGFEAINGNTPSNHFPFTPSAYEETNAYITGGGADAFLTRLNTSGQRDYSTMLGGDGGDYAYAVAVGADGIAYITGTSSTPGSGTDDFDLKNQYEGRDGSCCYGNDLFVSKFDTNASGAGSLVYSTLIGGSGTEGGTGIDVDSSGAAYITGVTGNASGGQYDTTPDKLNTANGSALVTKLSPAGSSLVWSTMIPNGGGLEPSGIALNGDDVYVAGTSKNATSLTTTSGALQTTRPGGSWDGFVTRISASTGPDTTPPVTTINSGPAHGSTVNTSFVSFGFAANEAATFQCKWDSESFQSCVSPASRTLADGNHTFTVRATDGSSNVETSPPSRTFTVSTGPPPDTTPPNTTITKAPDKTIKSKQLPVDLRFTFSSSESGSTFKCSFDGKAAKTCTSPATYDGDKGKHTFTVAATDAAGNADASPAKATVTVEKKKKKRKKK